MKLTKNVLVKLIKEEISQVVSEIGVETHGAIPPDEQEFVVLHTQEEIDLAKKLEDKLDMWVQIMPARWRKLNGGESAPLALIRFDYKEI